METHTVLWVMNGASLPPHRSIQFCVSKIVSKDTVARGMQQQTIGQQHNQRIIMKKILLIAIALLAQVPVYAGITYDEWLALTDTPTNRDEYLKPLSLDKRREIFLPKLEDFSRQVAELEGAAPQVQGEVTWFPKDVEGLYFEIRNYKNHYFYSVLQQYGALCCVITESAVERFICEYDALIAKQADYMMYPALKAIHLMLRLHKAYGVKNNL